MRPCSRQAFKVFNSDELEPVQLLDIVLVGQNPTNAIRITDAGETVTYNGNTYTPLPMSRGQVKEAVASSAGEFPAVQLTITNVGKHMASLLGQSEVEGAIATLRVTDRRLFGASMRPLDAVELTTGEISDLQLSDTVLTFQILHPMGQQERSIVPRRIYQTRPRCSMNPDSL